MIRFLNIQRLTSLPEYGVVEIVSDRPGVHQCDEQQVQAHAKVGRCQVAHEKLGNGQPESTAEQHKQYGDVAEQRGHGHDPYGHP